MVVISPPCDAAVAAQQDCEQHDRAIGHYLVAVRHRGHITTKLQSGWPYQWSPSARRVTQQSHHNQIADTMAALRKLSARRVTPESYINVTHKRSGNYLADPPDP